MGHLFVAEKPSLAEAIARARAAEIGASASKTDGHWKVGEDAVTWLFGHFYELAQPQEYDERYAKWTVEDLPIIPEKWRLVPRKSVMDQLNKVKRLLKESRSGIIVNAGDAAREGQLLIDEVLQECGLDPFAANVKRLWVKSMAEKDMIEALKAMFPNADKRNLFSSAVARQRADWTHGMNMTRLFTILARNGGASVLVSVGRVQTPTLKLVVDRDREIEAFKAVDHYLPKIVFRHANGTFEAEWIIPPDHPGVDSEGRLTDKSEAEKIAAKVNGRTGAVDAYASTQKSKSPPLPFNLSGLQKACSARFGMTAQGTLDVAQALYEKYKATTYPRSDSQHLPVSILSDEAPQIMRALTGTDQLGEAAKNANMALKSPAWNDAKISDHHGIIPTTEFSPAKLAQMEPRERDVFLMIARSFVAQFYPDRRWDAQSAAVSCEGERFKANGTTLRDAGWSVLYGAEDKDDDEEEDGKSLPDMRKADPVKAEGSRVDSKRTQPPKRFTDGTLIEAMSQVHRFVKDPEVKKKLKESSGIGTQATRAAIIETLLDSKRGFLRRDKKFLISTNTGRDVVDVVPVDVTDPGLTALWEDALGKVEAGTVSLEQFMEVQANSLRKRIETAKTQGVTVRGATQKVVKPIEGHGEACPKCGKGKLMTRMVGQGASKGKRFVACDNWRKNDPTACDYTAWPKEERPEVPPLPGHGETCPKCGKGQMITRLARASGSRFLSCNAWKKDDPNSCQHSAFPDEGRAKGSVLPGDGDTCTKCGKGKMRTRKSKAGSMFLACDNWRRDDPQGSCDNVDWSHANAQKGGGKPGAGKSSSAGGRSAGSGRSAPGARRAAKK